MEDPFSSPSRRVASHKPSLTTLISSVDLEKLSPSIRDETIAEDSSVELPSNAPLSHDSFQTRSPDEEWDTSKFLLSRRHTALDELRSELRAYLTTLRSSLVEVINTEYEAFIGLSLGLRHASVSTSLSTIRRPVLSIRAEVAAVKQELEKMRQKMSDVLEQRKEVRDKKAMLRRLLEMDDAVDKVETRLQLGAAGTERGEQRDLDSSSAVDSPAKRLERIAGEYNHMLYLVSKAGDLPFVKSLEPRISRITSTLHLDLSQLLTSILNSARSSTETLSPKTTREDLTSLLRTYASLDAIAEAEEIIRRVIVRPLVTKLIHRDVLNSVQSPVLPSISTFADASTNVASSNGALAPAIQLTLSDDQRAVPSAYLFEPIKMPDRERSTSDTLSQSQRGSLASEGTDTTTDPLLTLYNRILASISRDCGLILDVAERSIVSSAPAPTGALMLVNASNDNGTPKKKTHFDLLSHVVWDEAGNLLMSELGHVIFAAGRPTVFHQHYLITSAFISRIESFSPSLSHLIALRASPTYINFIKRFQLPVYFQLRFKEIVTGVERALDVGSASGGGDVFVMSESEAVWRALRVCWADEVWLEELNGRFWRLTLQLVSRYRTWINSVVPRYVMPSSSSGASLNVAGSNVAGSATPLGRSSFDGGERDRSRLSASAAPSPRSGTPAQSDEATEEATLRQLTVLIADTTLMERKLHELYDERIAPRLAGGTQQIIPRADDDKAESPAVVLRDSLAQTSSIVPSLSSQIMTILVKRCAEHLKLVRSTVSQVRASTRRGPLEPSYFVPNILKDLRAYVHGPAKVVDDELRTKWATAVVEEIAQRYTTVLSAQKKTDESLRWYKKGRTAGLSLFGRGATSTSSDDAAATPDDDRVKQQMQMDIDALAQDAANLGVDTRNSEAFKMLRNAIVDEDKK